MNSSLSVCFHIGEVNYKFTKTVVAIALISAVINIFGSIFAAVGNTLFIYVMLTKKELHTASNFLLTGLSISDLAVAVVAQPLSVVLRLHEAYDKQLCQLKTVYGAVSFIPSIASLSCVVLISLDRFFATTFPIKYRHSSDKKQIYVIICGIIWILSAVVVILTYARVVEANAFYKSLMVFFISASIVILICYVMINREMKARERRIQVLSVSRTAESLHQHEIRRYKTMVMILAAFYICYLPKFLHKLSLYFGVEDSNFVYAARIPDTFVYLNSGCNPCIYLYRNKIVRETVFQTLVNMQSRLWSCINGLPSRNSRVVTKSNPHHEQSHFHVEKNDLWTTGKGCNV